MVTSSRVPKKCFLESFFYQYRPVTLGLEITYLCMYVLVYTPCLLRVLRVFQISVLKSKLESSEMLYENYVHILVYTSSLLRVLRSLPPESVQTPPRATVEVLRKFPLVPTQETNPEPPAWKSGVLPPEPPVLS